MILEEPIIKITVSEKIKILQKKTQCDLDKTAAKISVWSSGNVNKYEFFNGKDVLPGKDLLRKADAMKKFVYSQ